MEGMRPSQQARDADAAARKHATGPGWSAAQARAAWGGVSIERGALATAEAFFGIGLLNAGMKAKPVPGRAGSRQEANWIPGEGRFKKGAWPCDDLGAWIPS